jgi:hypothetical protein
MKIISYRRSIKIRTPYGYNTDIQSLRVGFYGGGVMLRHWQKAAAIVDVIVDAGLT